jgi:hypothetical protein
VIGEILFEKSPNRLFADIETKFVMDERTNLAQMLWKHYDPLPYLGLFDPH